MKMMESPGKTMEESPDDPPRPPVMGVEAFPALAALPTPARRLSLASGER